jgi:hypothetical protein
MITLNGIKTTLKLHLKCLIHHKTVEIDYIQPTCKYKGCDLTIAIYRCIVPQWIRYQQGFPETYANGYL